MKRVLIVTAVAHWQRRRGNEQRIQSLLDYLTRYYQVTVCYLGSKPLPPPVANVRYMRIAGAAGWKQFVQMAADRLPDGLRYALIGFLNRRQFTRTPDYFVCRSTLSKFAEVLSEISPQVLIVEYIWYAYLLDAVESESILTVLDTHDLMHLRTQRYAESGLVPDRTASEQEEMKIIQRFDRVLAIQSSDRAYLQHRIGDKALLVPHAQPVHSKWYEWRLAQRKEGEPLNIIFLGSYSDQNLDSLGWFLEEIWNPELARHFCFHVYGTVCFGIKKGHGGVVLHGSIEDVNEAYRHADIAINPVRFGSGIKIKNVEAMSYGVPLVTTSIGAEGMGKKACECVLVADSASAFRKSLIALIDDNERRHLSLKAIAELAIGYSPDSCFRPLKNVIDNWNCA